MAQVTLFTKMAHEAYVIRWLLTKPFGALLKGIPTGETILRFPIWQNWNPHWEDHPVGVVFSRSLITPTTNWQSLVFSLYLFLCSLSLPLLSLSIPALPRHSPKHQIQGSHVWCGLGVPSWMVHYLSKAWCASITRLNVVKQNPSSTNLLWTWCIIYDGSLFEKGLL